MAIPVIMPKQGQSVETCIITKWFKQKGETIKSGDLLFSYETDKAAFDVESPADGTLLDILYGEGVEVPVLVKVAVIGSPGEITDSFPGMTKLRISPRARRFALKKGLDYNNLSGSGPNGRIICRDIEEALSADTPQKAMSYEQGVEFTEQALTNVRKIIARSMHASLQNSAQLTHHMSADVRHLLEARRRHKENLTKDPDAQDITLNDMICWCVIKALEKFREANSHFLEDRIKTFNKVHLGVAVDTPRGLMVAAVKNADEMDLKKLSQELKTASEACRIGNINPELLQSTAATFTVSNLGSYGVEMFTPVINLPQVAILGVCTIINRPADMGNNIFGFVPYIGLSLTYDHRAIDGAPATLFLNEIKKQIEEFIIQEEMKG
ncbi:MAG TPA: dihydrolipoamide acetyltransferase family protein [Bacteroidales bacterium]|nr:dihydrolipoamide acetyltransferase family protein [Bacteroidales bacterium]